MQLTWSKKKEKKRKRKKKLFGIKMMESWFHFSARVRVGLIFKLRTTLGAGN